MRRAPPKMLLGMRMPLSSRPWHVLTIRSTIATETSTSTQTKARESPRLQSPPVPSSLPIERGTRQILQIAKTPYSLAPIAFALTPPNIATKHLPKHIGETKVINHTIRSIPFIVDAQRKTMMFHHKFVFVFFPLPHLASPRSTYHVDRHMHNAKRCSRSTCFGPGFGYNSARPAFNLVSALHKLFASLKD